MSATNVFQISRRQDALVLEMHESTTAQWLNANCELHPLLDRPEFAGTIHIVVDCTRISFAGSMLLELLIRLGEWVQERGGRMVLCGLNDFVHEVVQVAGFNRLWGMYEDVDEALRSVHDAPSSR